MGLFNFGKKNKQLIKALSTQLQAVKNSLFAPIREINNSIALYPSWNITDQTKRYTATDDIYSIIRLISTTAALVPLYGYEIKPDKKAFNDLQRQLKKSVNPIKLKALSTKALEDLPEGDPLADLIEDPHETMSKYEFFEVIYASLPLYGEVFILKVRVELGPNRGKVIKLGFMHPANVVLRVSNTVPQRVLGYDYVVNGQVVMKNIPLEDVIHIKYFNPEVGMNGDELRGLSPIKVLIPRLTRMDSEMNVSVAQLQNGGVPGIVFEKGEITESTVEVTGMRKNNFYNYLSRNDSTGAPYFANGDMGYIQIGAMLADMQVAELANIDFKKLCNAFGVSDVLFNSTDTNSENNVNIQTKRLYTNTVLPDVYRVRDSLIMGLVNEFKDGFIYTDSEGVISKIPGDNKQRHIEADISDISELHEDLGKKATWLVNAYWLTPNEKREAMKYERFDNELMDQPVIPAGLQTLEDLVMIDPIEPITPNGN